MKSVYLDNAASTPMLPEVREELAIQSEKLQANASSIHSQGVNASRAVERAREQIAQSLNTSADSVVFTSGGTESNNWVIQSTFFQKKNHQNTIVTSLIEHPSVHAPIRWLQERFGVQVIYIGVDSEGRILIDDLKKSLNENVFLCSIMQVNNEVGSLQPMEEIATLCEQYNIPLHVDACQSFLKIPINLSQLKITYLTINSHKVHGPKGVGALYLREGYPLSPLFHGGGHESNRRSGTLNAPPIAAFGKAVEFHLKNPKAIHNLSQLTQWAAKRLTEKFSTLTINSPLSNCAPHILNIRFKDNLGKDVFWALNKHGVYVSTSSACSSNQMTPSHVLKAMGLEDKCNLESLRLSLGLLTTEQDIEALVESLEEIIK